MGSIQAGPLRAGGKDCPANWVARYGYCDLADIEPHCVIDTLTYGCGTVQFRPGNGEGTRNLGLRPLWPDAEREEIYKDFYSALQADIERDGLKVPVLLWKFNGKIYVRYGASRLWIFKKLGRKAIPSIICDFDCDENYPLTSWVPVKTPADVVEVLGRPKYIGIFEVSHERIDLHNVVPT